MVRPRWLIAVTIATALLAATAPAQEDVADVPAKERVAPEHEQMRYFLIGAEPAKDEARQPRPLLLVLPGGDGGADFHPFIKRIYKHALPQEFLVAQLVAPKWSPQQPVVWPTAFLPEPHAKFATEQFIGSVMEDVQKHYAVDEQRVYVLAWSSGGPAAYLMALRETTPIRGALIAMSVFKPDLLPPLENAQGRRFYLLHSPQDRVCPYRMAENAKRDLTAAGAEVELMTYPGGHGWRGDVFGNIHAGMTWLDHQPEAQERE